MLSVDAHGRLRVGDEGTGVDVEFLLEAVDAGMPGQPGSSSTARSHR